MNRKKKILFATIGIFVILFAIIGITYAYFVARVQGNTNTVSIQTKAGILSLVYGENQNDIIEATNILPGYTNTKNFTVTNNGSGTASYGVFLEELRNTFTRTSDLKLTVTCTSNISGNTCNGLAQSNFPTQNDLIISNSIDKDEIQTYTLTLNYLDVDTNQNADNNASLFAKVQIYDLDSTVDLSGTVENSQPGDYVVVNSSPKRSEIVNGTFKVVGLEAGNHTINVFDSSDILKSTNTISVELGTSESYDNDTITVTSNTRTVFKNIGNNINNNTDPIDTESEDNFASTILSNATNEGYYSENPETTPVVQTSGEYERTLSLHGNTYYFRGSVDNNYVDFADMCWRVVNINNGNVKIILEDQDTLCEFMDYNNGDGNWDIPISSTNTRKTAVFGYDENNKASYLNHYQTDSMVTAFQNFQERNLYNYLENLQSGNWCYDEIITDESNTYSMLNNNNIPETCNGTILNNYNDETEMYVGTLTADEVALAGATLGTQNTSFYLSNINDIQWLTLTPAYYRSDWDFIFTVNSGKLAPIKVSSKKALRPAVVIKENVSVSEGNGSQNSPYKIN